MSIDLPPPIDLYVTAENAGDIEAFSQCFAPDATVLDEGHSYRGQAAIKQWMAAAKAKYHHRIEPLAVADRAGETALTAKLTGNFPGSPVTVDFRFVIESGKIVSLEIGG
jgi:ketosteroid isomerase-like protein